MRIPTLALIMLLLGSVNLPGQNYRAGIASASIEPGDESFSVALSAYAGPWAGRFTVRWNVHGEINQHPKLKKKSQANPRRTRKVKGERYQIGTYNNL